MMATEITCPGCGTVSHFDQLRRSAQEFCRRCDYPLFWVRTGDGPAPGATEGVDTGLRRLPGAAGHLAVGSLGCPECNEPNLHTATVCIRCGSDLRPAPPLPPEPEPVVEPPPPPPVIEEPPGAIWPYMLLLVGLPSLVALLLLAVIT